VVNLPVAVTGDAGGARAWVAEHFGAAGRVPGYRTLFELEGAGGPADVVVAGDERSVASRLRRYADAGATEFIAVPFGSDAQIARTLTFLGELHQ
jgi:alkanesulfonate monooxygenase SsuD/methylene tetrahydromethanopterin reductase-like flavin-dependent oxidoreductase (luciferase family)